MPPLLLPPGLHLRGGLLLLTLIALPAPATGAEEAPDPILTTVVRLRTEAAATVDRARARLATAEADLRVSRAALEGARHEKSAAAAEVAREAVLVAEEEQRDAAKLVALATKRLAERQALADRFEQAGPSGPRTGSFALPLDGPVQRFGSGGRSVSDPAAPLQRGETVTTGSGGAARLLFDGGAVDVGLGSGSIMTLVSETAAGIEATLERGQLQLKALVLKNRKKFEVRTPSAICGIRGTAYRLEVGEGREVLTVSEGVVEVRPVSGGEAVLVRAGQRLTFGGAGAWEGPAPLPPAAPPEAAR